MLRGPPLLGTGTTCSEHESAFGSERPTHRLRNGPYLLIGEQRLEGVPTHDDQVELAFEEVADLVSLGLQDQVTLNPGDVASLPAAHFQHGQGRVRSHQTSAVPTFARRPLELAGPAPHIQD